MYTFVNVFYILSYLLINDYLYKYISFIFNIKYFFYTCLIKAIQIKIIKKHFQVNLSLSREREKICLSLVLMNDF
jgi:hypothetical protein